MWARTHVGAVRLHGRPEIACRDGKLVVTLHRPNAGTDARHHLQETHKQLNANTKTFHIMSKNIKAVERNSNIGHTGRNHFIPVSHSFSSKKLAISNKSRTFALTRTRQASPRCSNVRVVLFYYGTSYKTGEYGKQHILARFDWKKRPKNKGILSLNWK